MRDFLDVPLMESIIQLSDIGFEKKADNYYLYIHQESLTQSQAKDFCSQLSNPRCEVKLAILDTEEKYLAADSFIQTTTDGVLIDAIKTDTKINCEDAKCDGELTWGDGTSLNFESWVAGIIMNNEWGSNAIKMTTDGKYGDIFNVSEMKALCESKCL